MKINELKPGMLLRPKRGWRPVVGPLKSNILLDCMPLELIMVSDKEVGEDIMLMYLGVKYQNFLIDGVNKHHILSIGGNTILTTGYQFRYLVPDSELSL